MAILRFHNRLNTTKRRNIIKIHLISVKWQRPSFVSWSVRSCGLFVCVNKFNMCNLIWTIWTNRFTKSHNNHVNYSISLARSLSLPSMLVSRCHGSRSEDLHETNKRTLLGSGWLSESQSCSHLLIQMFNLSSSYLWTDSLFSHSHQQLLL